MNLPMKVEAALQLFGPAELNTTIIYDGDSRIYMALFNEGMYRFTPLPKEN